MNNIPTSAQINSIFVNSDSGTVWTRASFILGRINPEYDTSLIKYVFDDVMSVFRGEYPGYSSIKTLYHDKRHTLDVFMCSLRLIYGLRLSGSHLTDEEITLVMMATLMHDIGYSQVEGEEGGTGAQYTQTHVLRGIEFMKKYLIERKFPSHFPSLLEPLLNSTDPSLNFNLIRFTDERNRMLGQIVATSDVTAQMADRTYLEKLMFLYLEFKEANFGNYESLFDLLRKTKSFYWATREKLDNSLGNIYSLLSFYFKETLGVETNYYMESIEKNMAYLVKVVAQDEAGFLAMLKRGGFAERYQALELGKLAS